MCPLLQDALSEAEIDFHLSLRKDKREKFQLMMGLIRTEKLEQHPFEVQCLAFCHLVARLETAAVIRSPSLSDAFQ